MAMKRTSAAEDLLDLVSMMPWWAGVLLGLFSYLLLHATAAQPAVDVAQPGQIDAMIAQSLWRTFATFGQYGLPVIFLAGAAVSAWKRKKRQRLVVDVTQNKASEALHGMSWSEFEMLVGEGFRLQGYRVLETGGSGADGGVDLVLTRPGKKGSETFLVQCKQWRAFKVGVDVVRELYGVMAARGATGGFVVTAGRFTEDAIKFASGRNVALVDGPNLQGLLSQAHAGAVRSPARPAAESPVQSSVTSLQAASCPLCAKRMMRRTAKRGANAGGEFWGCTGYPACRGTRPLA